MALRDGPRAAGTRPPAKARATAAPSKQAASFEMLREDSDDDAAPPVPPPPVAPPVVGHRAADVRSAGPTRPLGPAWIAVFL